MSILEVQHIEKHFGSTRVLNDISFSLENTSVLKIVLVATRLRLCSLLQELLAILKWQRTNTLTLWGIS